MYLTIEKFKKEMKKCIEPGKKTLLLNPTWSDYVGITELIKILSKIDCDLKIKSNDRLIGKLRKTDDFHKIEGIFL